MSHFLRTRILIAILALVLVFATSPSVQAARENDVWVSRLGTYIETVYGSGLNVLINGVNKYLNFGSVSGSSGYGFRDNGGTIQVKSSGGNWNNVAGTGAAAGVTLEDVATNSTTAASSTYDMTATVPVEFETSDGNTLMYLDETNERVGIGTASPGVLLDLGTGDMRIPAGRLNLSNNTNNNLEYLYSPPGTGATYLGSRNNIVLLADNDNTADGTGIALKVGDNTKNGSTGTKVFVNGTGTGLLTTAPTHTLTLGSTGTGIALYNTADQTTNYERGILQWSGNALLFGTQNAGTGVARDLTIQSADDIRIKASNTLYLQADLTNSAARFLTGSTLSNGGDFVRVEGTYTASSGIQEMLEISPTISQSGTAGYRTFFINPTESSTGSGAKNLILAQVGGVDKLSVANTGITTITNTTDQASNQVLVLQGDRATPANNDEIYQSFLLSDAAGTQTEYARITSKAIDVTNTSEDGRIFLANMVGGTLTQQIVLDSTGLFPNANDLLPLGRGTNAFADLFLASGGVINWNNGDVTATHSSNALSFQGADDGYTFNGGSGQTSLLLNPTASGRFILHTAGTAGDDELWFAPNTGLSDTPVTTMVMKGGNVGIGTTTPGSKLQVQDGDVYVASSTHGIILKSPDGTCARGTIDNSDALTFASVTCP